MSALQWQAQPDVAIPPATSATVARKVEMVNLTISFACTIFVASIGASGTVVEPDLLIQVLARPQPKASANSNAEPGNAGLSLPQTRIPHSPDRMGDGALQTATAYEGATLHSRHDRVASKRVAQKIP